MTKPGYQQTPEHRANISASRNSPDSPNAAIVRIELTAARRRHLGDMAREAGISADVLASRLLTALIDDDAAAHGESV